MNLLTEYIIALVNLYGIVHKDKVVEIYNMQNMDKAATINMNTLRSGDKSIYEKDLVKCFTFVVDDFFVHECVLEFDEFDETLELKKGKPWYIPEKEELLRYADPHYLDITNEYKRLLNYLTKYLFNGDEEKANSLVEDIHGFIEIEAHLVDVMKLFTEKNVSFKNLEQANVVLSLVTDLANNTRIWSNNGYTPSELFKLNYNTNVPDLSKLISIGRNELCTCGSGKKYKNCCLKVE